MEQWERIKEVEGRREAVLEKMRGIRCMKRGTISEQYLKVPQKGKAEPVVRGPYYVLSRREGGKTVSERLSAVELEQARKDVAAHRQFSSLCKEYEALTEELGRLERQTGESAKKKQRK